MSQPATAQSLADLGGNNVSTSSVQTSCDLDPPYAFQVCSCDVCDTKSKQVQIDHEANIFDSSYDSKDSLMGDSMKYNEEGLSKERTIGVALNKVSTVEGNKVCSESTQNAGFRVKNGQDYTMVYTLSQQGDAQDRSDDFSRLINAHREIAQSGVPNYMGCRIPVPSKLNIPLWRSLLKDYHDQVLIELLSYGFPVGYSGYCLPVSQIKNHSGANDYSKYVSKYIQKEISLGVMAGPFASNPLSVPLTISPLNTVPKRDPAERRVIADLSFPPGTSVNDGIPRDIYLGDQIDLTFPSVDDLAARIRAVGPEALLFKKDLKRAYRQFLVDPGDVHLLGYYWDSAVYIDLALVMGVRSAAYICQRITTAIGFMFSQMGYSLINYIDDLAVCLHQSQASQAYMSLGKLLHNLGVEEAPDKACTPARQMEFLGVLFDIDDMTMNVTEDRIQEILLLIDKWQYKKKATKRQLQSLIGKLQFVAKCVRAGRVFISRLLHILPSLKYQHHRFYVNAEIKKDLNWWVSFLRKFNGVTIIPDMVWSAPDTLLATDACLSSLGAHCNGQYISCMFPSFVLDKKYCINTLELMTIMVALKMWSPYLTNLRVQIFCDNQVSVSVINSGKTKDKTLLAILREIVHTCVKVNCQIKLVHISGKDNRLPDYLSRAPVDKSARTKLTHMLDPSWVPVQVPDSCFEVTNDW
jgi:hypothetical protein